MADIYALVVDNSPVIRRIMSFVLEAEGCIVETAEDGLEALDRIAARRPDIVFTDLIMPKIDGEKLSYIIRQTPELQGIFLVILSGVALEDNDNTLRLGADVCIAKGPATEMKQHIKAALARFLAGERGGTTIEGMEGLYPREVTRELLVSKKHREVILARMTEGVVELDHTGRVVMANSAAAALFDLDEARVLGSQLAQLLPPPGREQMGAWLELIPAAAEFAPLVFGYDEPLHLGSRQVTLNLVPVPEDTQFFVIGILQDVTRRKMLEQRQRQLEKELQRIQKLDAMSLMASGIAHDFNNLLTIINGNIEMARYIARDETVASLLAESTKALELTTQLIRQFTTFSDNYLPQKSEVHLAGLINEVLTKEFAGTDIRHRISTPDDQLAITLDPNLLAQVFANLAKNVIEATGGAGTVEVTLDRVNGADEAARTGQPIVAGQMARIVVADSGPGISAGIIDQVFDPYFSTKQKGAQKGMGLGLTIVHSIVKKHGGLVWIDSSPGRGCAVHLYFPLQPAAELPPPGTRREAGRVLVMDDDEMMRLINQKMFEHCACRVSLAADGEEAVAKYRESHASGEGFDLVLLDLRVDCGMGGLEAAREIMAINPAAKIIAISGDTANEIMLRHGDYHFVEALAKPFSIDAIEEVVRRFL
jgi:two-component system, cell cycle sensor histidine kinase and response regulator CckA